MPEAVRDKPVLAALAHVNPAPQVGFAAQGELEAAVPDQDDDRDRDDFFPRRFGRGRRGRRRNRGRRVRGLFGRFGGRMMGGRGGGRR